MFKFRDSLPSHENRRRFYDPIFQSVWKDKSQKARMKKRRKDTNFMHPQRKRETKSQNPDPMLVVDPRSPPKRHEKWKKV